MQDVNDLQEELALANIALSDPSRQVCLDSKNGKN